MSFNGTGTYSLPAGNPVITGTTISSTVQNNTMNDIATALTDCVTRDGQSPLTAPMPAGGYKITGLGTGVALTDAASLKNIQNGSARDGGTVGGTANAITLAPVVTPTAYAAGQEWLFTATGTNSTAAPTIAVAGLAALPTTMGSIALPIGGILSGKLYRALVEAGATSIRVSPFDAASVDGDSYNGMNTYAKSANIASATSTDLTTATGNIVHITGSTTIASVVINQGQILDVIIDAAPLLTNGATFVLPGGANIQAAAGDRFHIVGDSANVGNVTNYQRSVVPSCQIQPITASVGSSALTITLNPTSLDFRSATIGSGTVTTISNAAAISVVVPSTATLGTVNAVQSRLVVLAINNAGTMELAVTNISGGSALDETGIISTTLIAAASNSATLYYSTTARASVAYRVVGYVESTQATAGTWATAPSTIQGYGGSACSAMSSLGYGQTLQDVTAGRALSTTYYNTTGKPITVVYTSTALVTITLMVGGVSVASHTAPLTFIVPPGQSYSITGGSIQKWSEIR